MLWRRDEATAFFGTVATLECARTAVIIDDSFGHNFLWASFDAGQMTETRIILGGVLLVRTLHHN